MTLEELKFIEKIFVNNGIVNLNDREAIRIIRREIKLRTTNYVTGKRTEGEEDARNDSKENL